MFITLPGCVTADKSAPSAEIGRTHYTLRYGSTVTPRPPLPVMTPIFLDWHYADGHVVTKQAFRAFDMNRDGTMDRLEILAEDGTIAATLDDFNFDGRPDQP